MPPVEQRDGAGLQKAEGNRLQRCAWVRQQLDVVTQGGPVFRREVQGGRYYLPDEARESEIARLRGDMARVCAGLDSDAATRARWREINDFVACDRARSQLRAFDEKQVWTSKQEYDQVARLAAQACAPDRFPQGTGSQGEWFRQYVLPGELRR